MNEQLVIPDHGFEDAFFSLIEEFKQYGETITPSAIDPENLNYPQWLDRIDAMRRLETCPEGLVPEDTYFLVATSLGILGAISIRHRLNEHLLRVGGNIGYGVRKSERRKGYAKLMLRLALEKCRILNLAKVLITCDKSNIASARTIMANGGILENEIEDGPNIKQRYWITLG